MLSSLTSSLAAAAFLSSTLASAVPGAGLLAPRDLNSDNFIDPHHARAEMPSLNKRRHHAKLADMAKRNISPRALLSLTGFATLYYDINGGGTCGPANGWHSFAETNGFTMCEPWTGPKTIAQRGSNKIAALPVHMMTGNLQKYCGKEVIARYNGREVRAIAWDGCAACSAGDGIDFSSSLFGELVGQENCNKGKVFGVTWEVTDKQVWDLNGNPVADNSNNWQEDKKEEEEKPWTPEPAPAPAPTTTSSKWVEPSPAPAPTPEQKWEEPKKEETKCEEPKKAEPQWEEPKKEEPKKEEPKKEEPKWEEPKKEEPKWEEPKNTAAQVKPDDNNKSADEERQPLQQDVQKSTSASKSLAKSHKGKCPARKRKSKLARA